VLRALGAAEDMAHSSLRFGMGRFTTEAEVDYVVDKIVGTVTRLREMRYVVFSRPLRSRH
jgi:cysteine desulfurase